MISSTPVAPSSLENKPSAEADVLAPDIPREEKELLSVYRRAKRMGYADINISIQEGKRVKLWLTEKLR
jgi:hypothetical protein